MGWIASIIYDIHDIATHGLNWGNGLSLAADVVSLALPVVTGGGAMVHAAMHADDAVHVATHLDDAVRVAEHIDEATEALAHADDAAEVLLHGSDELAEAAKAAETLAASSERPIVIGENMERVQRYADEIGGQTISDFVENWSIEENERWIRQMRAEGREIIDIGPDFVRRRRRIAQGIRPDASAYNLERRILQGYEGYFKAFQRSGKYWGGVPGFDWLIRSAQ